VILLAFSFLFLDIDYQRLRVKIILNLTFFINLMLIFDFKHFRTIYYSFII